MAKTADIGSKRLISLDPNGWIQWLVGDPTLEYVDVFSGEFQWISRANDVMIKAKSPLYGEFLIANEIQMRPHKQMGQRLRVYTALGEERYQLPVYPAVVNILPPAKNKVVNLWEVDVRLVFERNLSPLLPYCSRLERWARRSYPK